MTYRDYIISFVLHIVILGGLVLASNLGSKPKFQELNYYTVTAVSASSISELLRESDKTAEPEPKVPQVKKEEKVLPVTKPRKKSQEIKKAKVQDTASVSKEKKTGTSQSGTGVEGIQTENVFQFPEYLIKLRDLVEQKWNPPSNIPDATKAVIYFKIDKNGKIVRLIVRQTSGNKNFDASAYNAIVNCDPFPPLPDAYTENTLGIFFEFLP